MVVRSGVSILLSGLAFSLQAHPPGVLRGDFIELRLIIATGFFCGLALNPCATFCTLYAWRSLLMSSWRSVSAVHLRVGTFRSGRVHIRLFLLKFRRSRWRLAQPLQENLSRGSIILGPPRVSGRVARRWR